MTQSNIQELYSKSKLRQPKAVEPVAMPVSQVGFPITYVAQIADVQLKVDDNAKRISDIYSQLEALNNGIEQLNVANEKCQKSKISEEYNHFITSYNTTLGDLQNCIIDLSKRLAEAGF